MTCDSDSGPVAREGAAEQPTSTPSASPPTVNDLLEIWFPGRDVAAFVQRAVVQSAAVVEEQLIRWAPVLAKFREGFERVERLPPAPGYEPLLIERGEHPLSARMTSYLVLNLSAVATTQAQMERRVIEAIRFLAKPGRGKRAVSRRVETLLSDSDGTSALSCLGNARVSLNDLSSALDAFARGDPGACERLTQAAAAIAPRLAVQRGPKAKQATIGHEMLLTQIGPAKYTWDPVQEDFIDPITLATRLAFGNADFDPRPALRRERRRLREDPDL